MYRFILFFLLLFCSIITKLSATRSRTENHNFDFDVLLFTQQWPPTSCWSWKENNKNNVCQLPSPKGVWTIHGIWPTKYGTLGPFHCNKTWDFDINQIAGIEKQMEQFWINIEKGTPLDALWRHEWTKHGTCAALLPELNSENKYFGQGLHWLQQFTMESILKQSDILPDTENSVLKIQEAVMKVLKVQPVIHCVYDRVTDVNYLSEIRICFNKTLELIDCDGVIGDYAMEYDYHKIITNCDVDKLIKYPSIVPPTSYQQLQDDYDDQEWKFPYVDFYKLIQLIKWFTL